MTSMDSPEPALTAFDEARTRFEKRLAAAPEDSLRYLKPGDDYALGGLVHHVNAVLEHYLGVVDTAAGSASGGEVSDRPGLFAEANARAKAGVGAAELADALAELERLHGAVRTRVLALGSADFERKVPIRYEPGAQPLPTSPADVVGWLTGHYEEHVPHVDQLLASWEGSR